MRAAIPIDMSELEEWNRHPGKSLLGRLFHVTEHVGAVTIFCFVVGVDVVSHSNTSLPPVLLRHTSERDRIHTDMDWRHSQYGLAQLTLCVPPPLLIGISLQDRHFGHGGDARARACGEMMRAGRLQRVWEGYSLGKYERRVKELVCRGRGSRSSGSPRLEFEGSTMTFWTSKVFFFGFRVTTTSPLPRSRIAPTLFRHHALDTVYFHDERS
ncbi:hypothetical protein DFP72DRAFT_851961 [Ephemerocybe angulata]|uniref:Uncharacterized protein n=1 Tax=Ephemerocybe angulata TaxID=980116 RepID=A0A8H6HNH3_9AGAR|nr:hypothetical protein DFP72DRAFT_851961 [Tulosesus angulatus]